MIAIKDVGLALGMFVTLVGCAAKSGGNSPIENPADAGSHAVPVSDLYARSKQFMATWADSSFLEFGSNVLVGPLHEAEQGREYFGLVLTCMGRAPAPEYSYRTSIKHHTDYEVIGADLLGTSAVLVHGETAGGESIIELWSFDPAIGPDADIEKRVVYQGADLRVLDVALDLTLRAAHFAAQGASGSVGLYFADLADLDSAPRLVADSNTYPDFLAFESMVTGFAAEPERTLTIFLWWDLAPDPENVMDYLLLMDTDNDGLMDSCESYQYDY